MSKRITRFLGLMIAIAMILSLAACTPTTTKTPSSDKTESSQSSVDGTNSQPEEVVSQITDEFPSDVIADPDPFIPDSGIMGDDQQIGDILPGDIIIDNGDVLPNDGVIDGSQPGGEIIPDDGIVDDGQPGGDIIPDDGIIDDGQPGGDIIPDDGIIDDGQPNGDIVPDDGIVDDGQPGGDVIPGDGWIDDGNQDITPMSPVIRPETDGAISVGMKLAYTAEEEEDDSFFEDDDLDGEDEEDWEIGDDIVEDFTFEKIIEPYGTLEPDGKKRVINVDNSKDGILFKGFTGISTNVYPTQSTLMSQQKTGDRDAFVEINGDRFNNMKASFARSWFQIDWMMTDECAEKGLNPKDFNNNWEENPDYQNYYNGIYDFESDYMKSCIEYWKMLEEADTEIYLAFGWKIANRIQGWFSSDMRYSRESAPRDLDAYADACVALYKYVREEVGLTNFSTLAFYNEPGQVFTGGIPYQDFSVSGDKRVWWANMVKKCRTALDKNGLEDVIISSCDHSGTVMTNDDRYVSVYLNNHIPELIDMVGLHIYPGRVWLTPNGYDAQYEILCDAMRYMATLYGEEKTYVTEYYGTVRNDPSSTYAWELHGWDTSNAAFLISAANNGIRGNFHWGFTGGYLCDPMMFDPANGSAASWMVPRNEKTVADVKHGFYECSLINNYIPKNANVHNIEWAGDDIRASAFTSKDGKDFSLLVEAAEESKKKEIDVTLSESLEGRDINVFYYNFDLEYTPNAIIPSLFDTVKNVGNEFTYKIDGDYGIYIFTTLKPVEQIALYNPDDTTEAAVYNYVAQNGEVSIKPEFIDSDETVSKDTVIWDIKRYSVAPGTDADGEQLQSESLHKTSNKLGTLKVADDGTVTYKPRKDAKVGDIIAIRCTLKSDSDVWCSAIIEVKN